MLRSLSEKMKKQRAAPVRKSLLVFRKSADEEVIRIVIDAKCFRWYCRIEGLELAIEHS